MADKRNLERTRSATRRRLLRLGGVGVGTLLAGCSGSTDGTGDDETTADKTETDTEGTTIDGGITTTSGTTTTGGTDELTPWQWRQADPGQTFATPDPAPESLKVTATYKLESGGGRGAPPAVTDAGVFLLGTDPARIDTTSGSAAYSRSASGGHAFVQDGILVVPREYQGRIIGYRASDGERMWVAEPGKVVPFPTVDGVGYVGDDALGVLEPDSGEPRWEKTRGESEPWFSQGVGRVAWVVHPGSGTLFGGRYKPYENRLVAVEAYDAATGERRWRREDVPAPFAVHGDMLLASGGSASVVALDRTSGDELWRALEERYPSTRGGYAVDDEGVYVWTDVTGADVVALDPANGEERWRKPFTGRLGGTIATGDAVVYNTAKSLRLLSKDDGSELLAKRDDAAGASQVAAAGGRLYVTMGIYGSGLRVYGSG